MPLAGPVLSHRRVVVAPTFHRPAMQHWSTHASIFSTAVPFSEHGKRDWVTLLAAGHLSNYAIRGLDVAFENLCPPYATLNFSVPRLMPETYQTVVDRI